MTARPVRPHVAVGGWAVQQPPRDARRQSGRVPDRAPAGGAHIDLTRRIGVRGELRFRRNTYVFDSYDGPYTSMANDFEQTAGLFWRF